MARSKMVAMVGAVVGLVLYTFTAFKAALMYGGYGGLLLATGMFGAPLEPTLLARGLIGFGMVLGAFAAGTVFAVCGAGTASFLVYLVTGAAQPAAKEAHEAAGAHR